MKNFKFNIEEAIQFSKEGCLEEWIHIFLRTFGGNLALSEGLKLEKRNWTGPALVPINQLIRCCGPEGEWNIIIRTMIGRNVLVIFVN